MSDRLDREYYTSRAAAARALAESAKSEHVAAIHRTMAALYDDLAHLADNDEEPELSDATG